jgi:hypothetical protein
VRRDVRVRQAEQVVTDFGREIDLGRLATDYDNDGQSLTSRGPDSRM